MDSTYVESTPQGRLTFVTTILFMDIQTEPAKSLMYMVHGGVNERGGLVL